MSIYEAKEETFDSLIREGVSIIDFYSTHCGPCRALLPSLLEIEGELPFINLVKVNTDNCPGLADRFRIQALPTIYLSKDGIPQEFTDIRSIDSIRQALGSLIYE